VTTIDPQLPVSDVQPLQEIVRRDTETRVVQARVLGAFAAVACVLSAIGLHGLLAFVVSARTREIGVRVALGARRVDILGMVLGRGVRLSLIGAAAGIVVAWLAGTSLRAILAGIDPADGVTIGTAAMLALGMACAGSVLPAIRAARTDPMVATKAE
jgi:ABC-type antimicrobial peptide transport system permease subunit